MRALGLGILASTGLALSALPALAEPATTRIEPRAFYGATVTIEEGVRVFRPLPPHDRVIINPNNAPVYLGFEEKRVTSTNHNYNYPADTAGGDDGCVGCGSAFLPQGRFKGHGKGHHGPRPGGFGAR